MKPINHIRSKLGISQSALAQGIGVTQGNVSHYERGQTIPPDVAARIIQFAKAHGLSVSFDDIYSDRATQPTKEPTHA